MKCKVCNKKLTGSQTTFCSNECRKEAHRLLMASRYKPVNRNKTCFLEECDVTFIARVGQKFCCLKCAAKHKAKLGKIKAQKQQAAYRIKKPKFTSGLSYKRDTSCDSSGYF